MTSQLPLAQLSADPRSAWAPVVLLLLIAIGFAVGNLVLSLIIGPSRTGPGKETTYESGMVPVGDTRRRFNVRFYIVAMIFLVIDVEIVFFYPWASIFAPVSATGDAHMTNLLMGRIIVFTVLMLVGYIYGWGKGIFRWD
ncbi:MAG TPA: NADH-quinone oxidoreductase subunit A [Tepidisphaeraceae bacterium]|nr:NADH-quinone oxidoreductase subunit A [Tepidisphaeraceae bacterium]